MSYPFYNSRPSSYGEWRRSIYASFSGRKAAFNMLKKSDLLKKDEKEQLQKVIDELDKLRVIFRKNHTPKEKLENDGIISP